MPLPAPPTFVQLCRMNNIAAFQRTNAFSSSATLLHSHLKASPPRVSRSAALHFPGRGILFKIPPIRTRGRHSSLPRCKPTCKGLYTVPPYKVAPPTPSNARRLQDFEQLRRTTPVSDRRQAQMAHVRRASLPIGARSIPNARPVLGHVVQDARQTTRILQTGRHGELA
jgi:hypothetical protein